MSSLTHAAIAAHRFGLGEPDLAVVGGDAQGWLLAQIGAADPQRGDALPTAAEGLRRHDAYLRRLQARAADASAPAKPFEQQFADHFRELVQADLAARLGTAATTQRPFAERLALFWANHFTVSMAKGAARGLVGSFEREAIRPHIAGHFDQLLMASTQHAAMLRYLDNALSAGPHSRIVARLARQQRDDGVAPRITGLNENLAREVLELHTLGVDGGYTQADVTAFAAVLTGWRAPRLPRGEQASFFDAAWHEPGPKTVLGKRYDEGPQALTELLRDLARHPSTARFVSTKLARHFVADEPPAALVDRLGAQLFQTAPATCPRSIASWCAHPKRGSRRPPSSRRRKNWSSPARACCAWAMPCWRAAAMPAPASWASACRPRRRPPAGPTAPKSGWAPTRCGSASNGPRASAIAWGARSMHAHSPASRSARG